MRNDSFIVIWVDTDAVTLEVKGVLTELCMSQFVLVEIGPSPYLGIDHMWKPFPTSNL